MKSFIEGRAKTIDDLEVSYKPGQRPVLTLMNEEGEREEEVPLSGWTAEAMEEFLNEKLGGQ